MNISTELKSLNQTGINCEPLHTDNKVYKHMALLSLSQSPDLSED